MAHDLQSFHARYDSVLEAAARRVHALALRGQKYVATADIADWVIHDLPTLTRKTWGAKLKPWRVHRMLQDAAFLGAYEKLDIRSVRGRGLTPVVRPRRLRAVA